MKAAIHARYGPPSVIHIKELEIPIVKNNELLIRIHATTVNRTDCAYLTAKPVLMRLFLGPFKPIKQCSGTDFSGTVEAIGKDVTLFKPGDQVFGFDDNGISSHAEYMSIAEDKAISTIPENISFEEAAACIEGAHYAINFINKVKIEAGQQVMVNGGTGAIGSALIQLLNNLGVNVTATCKTKDMDLIKSIGAKEVIDYTKSDFTQSNHKFDFVFDAVGKSSFGKCKRILVPHGTYISSELGWMAENLFFALTTPVMGGKKVRFPYPADKPGSVLFMQNLLKEGKYKPVIDRKYPFAEIAEAFRYVLTGEKVGNVVINMENWNTGV